MSIFKSCSKCGGLGKMLVKVKQRTKGGDVYWIKERETCSACRGSGLKS